MKYQIDTIPVLKAYEKESECPLCLLKEKAEAAGLRYYLGHSVMVPEVRIELNKTGFCGPHFNALLGAEESRLGLALMTHTRTLTVIEEMKQELSGGLTAAAEKKGKKWAVKARKNDEACPLCAEVDQTLLRYAATIAWLWDNEDDFPDILKKSRGFCQGHFPLLLETGPVMLQKKKYAGYYNEIVALQIKEMERLAGEVEWYTKKFDTANKDEPWGSSKDALPRGVGKLIGF